jgi:hypothetical protein
MLYIWAVRHPAVGYVQGINDVITPFFYVYLACTLGRVKRVGISFLNFGLDGEDLDSYVLEDISEEALLHVEADTFWSLCKIFEGIQENYTFAQPGIQKMLFALEELIRRIDGKLCSTGNQAQAQTKICQNPYIVT